MKFRGSVLLLLAMGSILAMSSCVKKYTCQCKLTYSGSPGLPDSSVREYDIYDNKDGAETKCKNESYEHNENGIKIKEACALY